VLACTGPPVADVRTPLELERARVDPESVWILATASSYLVHRRCSSDLVVPVWLHLIPSKREPDLRGGGSGDAILAYTTCAERGEHRAYRLPYADAWRLEPFADKWGIVERSAPLAITTARRWVIRNARSPRSGSTSASCRSSRGFLSDPSKTSS
jgi:hypothetical protein